MISPAKPRLAVSKPQSSKRMSREQRRRAREHSRRIESRVLETDSEPMGLDPPAEGVDTDATPHRENALTTSDPAGDGRPQAYLRPGLVQRLFGSGARVEDAQTGLVHYDQKPGLLRPLARREYQREAALGSIRRGFEDLSDLMSDIRDGLEASVEKQGELLEHLKYLPVVAEQNARSAERLEEQFQAQNRLQMETIKSIRDQSRGQFEQQETLNKVLGGMGRESRDQKRDVDELQGRLERMRQSDQAIADNLSTVGTAVRKVSEQSAAHGELALRMQQAFDERTRQLESNLQRQSRRQFWMFTAALLIAAVAIGAAAVIGFFYLQQAGAA